MQGLCEYVSNTDPDTEQVCEKEVKWVETRFRKLKIRKYFQDWNKRKNKIKIDEEKENFKGKGTGQRTLCETLTLRGHNSPFLRPRESAKESIGPSGLYCFPKNITYSRKSEARTSLVAQWLRIRLPMQDTRVQALVWEDPTCHGAMKPVHHNYWACALEPVSHNYWACALEPMRHNYWAHVPQLLKPVCLEPVLRNKRSHRNEKPTHRNEE